MPPKYEYRRRLQHYQEDALRGAGPPLIFVGTKITEAASDDGIGAG
jgi:hypothetical protein